MTTIIGLVPGLRCTLTSATVWCRTNGGASRSFEPAGSWQLIDQLVIDRLVVSADDLPALRGVGGTPWVFSRVGPPPPSVTRAAHGPIPALELLNGPSPRAFLWFRAGVRTSTALAVERRPVRKRHQDVRVGSEQDPRRNRRASFDGQRPRAGGAMSEPWPTLDHP